MKENNKKSISAFLSFIAISFFGGNTITNAVQTTNEYPAPLSSTVDYSAKKLVRPLSYVNQCKNNTNQNLSFLALNKSKTIPFDTNLTKSLSFSHGLSRAFLYSARYDQEDYYLDFLFTLSQKQDEHSLLEFLEHTYHGFMTNMILTLNFDNKTEKSKTYTNKKTIDFRKALLEKEKEKEKESTKNLPKELSNIDRKWVKMGKMDLLNTLTSFFNLQKDKWKACQISFRHNSDIHTVAISYNKSSDKYSYYSYYDSNEKNGVHLIGWPAPAHLITSH